MKSLEPIITAHLFPQLDEQLVVLLRSLNADEWNAPTIVPNWRVKDIAAHLLDTALRRLSLARDGYFAEAPTDGDFVGFINRLNHEGVTVYRRLSPSVLIALMEVATRECAEHFASLNPFGKAVFAVSWAGESESLNWFDIAREFTERWHHQQQIRLAVNREGIMTREFYFPVLDAFMRALPFHYRNVTAVSGTLLRFDVTGEGGGSWTLFREGEQWRLIKDASENLVAHITIPPEIAWRIFTKGLSQEAARAQTHCTGDEALGLQVLRMLSIVG
ncbi:MAG: maleylpyruvate isomerase family protein [Acidobacteria bacterium]|nr:maleylpyruvate isomerase family protein [Acidobacteriota bacterium]